MLVHKHCANQHRFSLSDLPDFISIQKECSSLMNVIKAGGEALGGCQQGDCWVACREGTSHGQCRCSCFSPGCYQERRRELEKQNMTMWGSQLFSWAYGFTRKSGAVGVAAMCHLNTAEDGARQTPFWGAMQRIAILKCFACGKWVLIKTEPTLHLDSWEADCELVRSHDSISCISEWYSSFHQPFSFSHIHMYSESAFSFLFVKYEMKSPSLSFSSQYWYQSGLCVFSTHGLHITPENRENIPEL